MVLREGADALAEAARRAAAGGERGGAGVLPWVRAFGRVEAAVVLEPELPLAGARLALLAGANALADALAAFGLPEIPIGFRWPATLLANGAACGGLRLVAPAGAVAAAVPAWLVVGFEVPLAFAAGHEPGRDPGTTVLEEEGFGTLEPAALVGAWARHLLAGIDDWGANGPQRLAERFLARLLDPAEAAAVRRGIDPATGDLLLERDGAVTRRAIVA